MKIPKIGIDRDEETWSFSVGSIYVDARRYGSSHKVHDLRTEHVTRVSNALRSINYDPSRKFSGKDLQQLVDETKQKHERTIFLFENSKCFHLNWLNTLLTL